MKCFKEVIQSEPILRAMADLQFEEPKPIQSQFIPVAMQGSDIIASSKTGSGKTLAYLLPMIELLYDKPKSKGLVLVPTRELAMQVSDVLKKLTKYCGDEFRSVSLTGGTDIRKQFKALQKKQRIVVGTPGRVADHLRRNTLQINNAEIVALDEGDRMLDMGFEPQIRDILKFAPQKKQMMLLTATLDQRIAKLSGKYLHKPKKILVGGKPAPVKSIKQSVIQVKFKEKDSCIVDELVERKSSSAIVFLRTQKRVEILTKHLRGFGFNVDMIHGGRTQAQRTRAINGFRKGKSTVLCATDVASRGIDVPEVSHVFNYDLPMMDEDFVHRVGRTARNGAEGEAVSFVTPEEHSTWNKIAKKYELAHLSLPESEKRNGKGKSEGRGRGNGKGKPRFRSKFKSKAGSKRNSSGTRKRRSKS